MTISEIAVLANQATDENYSVNLITGYVNQAIARINVTLDANFPLFLSADYDFVALSDSWIHLLFVTYASYAIKMNDGSLNEADRYRNEFENNFRLLEENKFKAVPTSYRGENFGNMYYMKADNGINVGWFTSRNKNEDGF